MEFLNQIQDTMADYIILKLKETGEEFWDTLDDEKKERLISVIKVLTKLPLESIFDEKKQDTLKMDIKSATNAIAADLGSTLLKARKKTRDPIARAIFNLGVALLK